MTRRKICTYLKPIPGNVFQYLSVRFFNTCYMFSYTSVELGQMIYTTFWLAYTEIPFLVYPHKLDPQL